MSAIRITDVVGPVTYLHICNDSSLDDAEPIELPSAFTSLIVDFGKTVDLPHVTTISVSAQLAKPSSLIDRLPDPTVNGRINNSSAVLNPLIKSYSQLIARPVPSIAAYHTRIGSEGATRGGGVTTIELDYYPE
jgi:hypothetical protein